ncbi:MAG: PilZ domain-containing protein [Gammaproteobacteria bacterium]|nr:PilZ domain-containing protein [Gammaproteobacteria bacterium]
MTQKSDNQERRDFFRIDDVVTMELSPIESGDFDAADLPTAFKLLHEIRKIDGENAALLLNIQEKYRDLANYLRSQNEKLDTIARHFIDQLGGNFKRQEVNISGGGLKFESQTEYPVGSMWHLKLMLYPDCYGFYCTTKVVQSDKNGDRYTIGLEFEEINTHDQDELVKHITKLQSKQLRQERLGE